MSLLATKGHEGDLWRTHSCVLRRDSSRRLADIDMSVDAARKSACATRRLQRPIQSTFRTTGLPWGV